MRDPLFALRELPPLTKAEEATIRKITEVAKKTDVRVLIIDERAVRAEMGPSEKKAPKS